VRNETFRLIGFDAAETGDQARCAYERELGDRATARLRQLIGSAASSELTPVPCACRPGTHGTRECNYGRSCGTLRANGRDVGPVLIAEGLARRYVCGATSCPPRQSWC
jgi:endonuclease YncB( thermonuclease family)